PLPHSTVTGNGRYRSRMRGPSFLAGAMVLAGVVGCGGGEELYDGMFTSAEVAKLRALGPLPSLKPDTTNQYADDPAAAALGQRLFFESGYSGAIVVGDDGENGGLGAAGETGKVSCRSC